MSSHRPEIDGLRAVAVVPVVAYHADSAVLPGGFVGVDVFFVISGYLITGLLCAELDKSGHISIAGFFERRIRRLAPSLLLVVATTLLLGFFFLSPIGGEQQGLARTALAALVLSANVYFFVFTGGYFDGPAEAQPLLHLWSLAVEEQFYLVWPWAIWIAYTVANRGQPTSNGPALYRLFLFAALFVVSLLACLLLTPSENGAAFYLSPMRAWEFAAGALAFWWLRYRAGLALDIGRAIALLGIALIATAYFAVDKSMSFPGYLALLPVLGAVLVIVGTASDPDGPVTSALKCRFMVWIGLISYPLYLWHWPLLVMARINSLEPLQAWQAATLVALAVTLSWATLKWVETPIRTRRLSSISTPRRVCIASAQATCLVAVIAVIMGVWSKWIWPSREANAAFAAALNGLQKVRVPCAQPAPYTGTLEEQVNCGLDDLNGHTRKTIFVWGDSHAAHLVPGLKHVAAQSNQALRIRYMPECPPLLGFSPGSVGLTRPKGCEQYNADVLAEVKGLQSQGLLAGVYLNARWAGYTRFGTQLQGASDGLNASLAALQQAGVKVTVMAPGPEFRAEVPRCLARRPADSCDLLRDEADTARAATLAMIRERTAAAHARLMDPFDALCNANRCPALTDGEVLYSDSHHWTVPASVAVASAMAHERQ